MSEEEIIQNLKDLYKWLLQMSKHTTTLYKREATALSLTIKMLEDNKNEFSRSDEGFQ